MHVGEGVELVDVHAEGSLVALLPEDLAQGALLLHIEQEDPADRLRLGREQVRGKLRVDDQVLLQHLVEDDVRVVRVDERRLELVQGTDDAGKTLLHIVAQADELRLDLLGRPSIDRVDAAIVEGVLPPGVVGTDAFEADGDVFHGEGQPAALLVHHPVQQPADVVEHDAGLGVEVLVVAKLGRERGENTVRCGDWIAARVVRATRPHVDHIVGMARELRLVPGRQGEHPQLLGPTSEERNRLHHPDVLVATLGIDDEDALAIERVLQHRRPQDTGGLPRPRLAQHVPVHRLLPLADVDGTPGPSQTAPASFQPDKQRSRGATGDLRQHVDLSLREFQLLRPEKRAGDPGDHLVVPKEERGTRPEQYNTHHGRTGEHCKPWMSREGRAQALVGEQGRPKDAGERRQLAREYARARKAEGDLADTDGDRDRNERSHRKRNHFPWTAGRGHTAHCLLPSCVL